MTSKTVLISCWALTFLAFGVVVYGLFFDGFATPINELGDALSGFASTFALIWLVGAYYLQHFELSDTRKEYVKMRETMDDQLKLASQESLLKIVRLYLESLTSAAQNFQLVSGPITKQVFQRNLGTVSPIHSFGYFANCLEKTQGAKREALIEKLPKYEEALSKEVERYKIKYHEMIEFLSENEGGSSIKKILIDGSVYADVYEKILEAGRGSKHAQRIYGATKL